MKEDDIDKLVNSCWDQVEASLLAREKEFGLYVFLYQVRRIYLREIDEQWIAHLKNIEQLRAGIGLLGYANKNPKNAYKIEGFALFRDMWDSIEQTVLDQVLQMRLSEEDKRRAEEGAEYETALTRANGPDAATPLAAPVEGPSFGETLMSALDDSSPRPHVSSPDDSGVHPAVQIALDKVNDQNVVEGHALAITMPVKTKVERAMPVMDHVTKSCKTPTSLIRRLIKRPTL